jgi:acetate kinase
VRILTVNAGSTSLKVVDVVDGRATTHHDSLDDALAGAPPDVVAHRIVHGGDRTGAALVDDELVAALTALTELAPLHQPPALAALDRCRATWPDVPNVASFDTAFHSTIPESRRTYAIPARFRATVRVYGFHGLSHAWAVGRTAMLAPGAGRVLVAHLGGGQSLCAALDGRSAMTTMGFTPGDGLVMATRSGSIDPGAVLWLVKHAGVDVEAVLEQESGLLGLSGTADMRELHARIAAGDDVAALAFAVWRERAVAAAGACVAAMGGLDALVFTGGIGEHDGIARSAIAGGLAWLGVAVDETDVTDDGEREITGSDATVRTFVVPSREDLQLAAEASAVVDRPVP